MKADLIDCPYCGETQERDDLIECLPDCDGDTMDVNCESCGKDFKVTCSVEYEVEEL